MSQTAHRSARTSTSLVSLVSLSLALLILVLLSLVTVDPSAAWSWGCPSDDEPEIHGRETHDFPSDIAHDEPFDTSEGCPNWRWIGLRPASADRCPRPDAVHRGGIWDVRPLFSNAAGEGDSTGTLPASLTPFCLYETDHPDSEIRARMNEELENLLESGELLRAESGCAAVAPMASTTRQAQQVDSSWDLLRGQFFDHAEPLGGVFVETSYGEKADAEDDPPRVRIAIIDTQPASDQSATEGYANSPHGLALLRLGRELVCRQGDASEYPQRCAAVVEPELGLPILELDWDDPSDTVEDFENGGHYGTTEQLARATWRAVQAWDESGPEHLVLNFSVGWVGEHYGGLEDEVEQMPLGVQALYRALQVARCRGALAVAASGNEVGGPEIESGPLLPGAWQRRTAPSASDCRELLGGDYLDSLGELGRDLREQLAEAPVGGSGTDAPAASAAPLVYAAGGVHRDNVPLVNARPGSEPPRVAFADHAVAWEARDDRWPAILTGSSVSSVVVSAAAASVWHYRPELEVDELMRLVDASGQSLHRPADVYLGERQGTRPPVVRRVAVCSAVDHALSTACDGDGCPRAWCPGDTAALTQLNQLDATCATIELGQQLTVDTYQKGPDQDFCDRLTLHTKPGQDVDVPCPFRQFYGVCARPWGCPQPGSDPCLNCGLGDPPDDPPSGSTLRRATTPEKSLRIHFDPAWGGGELLAVSLGIGDARFALDLDLTFDPQKGETPPRCVLVNGIDPALFERSVDTGQVPTAALYFHTRKGSVESPIFFSR